MLKNLFGHLHTINKHHRIVRHLCFKMGLYYQGFVHDLSKYSPTEFLTGVKYYSGSRSPNAVEQQEKGYSEAWLHHKGRNKHHWQYWVNNSKSEGLYVVEMPKKYIKEMLADRIAACLVYQKENYTSTSPLEYFNTSPETNHIPPKTKEILKEYLEIVAENDLDTAIKIIKRK